MAPLLLCCLIACVLVPSRSDAPNATTLWRKHFLTYSIESSYLNESDIERAVHEWDISPILEFKLVPRGQGDIKFYIVLDLPRRISGRTLPPEVAIIHINGLIYFLPDVNATVIYQHEFGHALGLDHSADNRSTLYFTPYPWARILDSDKQRLRELYHCRYDSVMLLDDTTYVKFRGRHYDRLDLRTEEVTRHRLWHPSLTTVSTLYRNQSHYYILSDPHYYRFSGRMQLETIGLISEIFPNMTGTISSVLTLKNGTLIAFLDDTYMWSNGTERSRHSFSEFPRSYIQGSFSTQNAIYLMSKEEVFIYDHNLTLLNHTRLCDHPKLRRIHCCNPYSNWIH